MGNLLGRKDLLKRGLVLGGMVFLFNRILHAEFKTTDQAQTVLGQKTFTTDFPDRADDYATRDSLWYPRDISVCGNWMFVADNLNHRILRYSRPSAGESFKSDADLVLGQTTFDSNIKPTAPSETSVSYPTGIHCDGDKLMMADGGFHRVLIWNNVGTLSNNKKANIVLGQSSFTTRVVGSSPAQMYDPHGVWVAGGKLFVADGYNHRILIWNNLSSLTNGKAADVVLGGPTAGTSSTRFNTPQNVFSDGSCLLVSDWKNNRVLYWATIPAVSNTPADKVFGQDNFTASAPLPTNARDAYHFSSPRGLHYKDGKLLVVDSGNYRVLVYDAPNLLSSTMETFKTLPVAVLGQESPGSATSEPTNKRLHLPQSALLLANAAYVVADSYNNRIVELKGNFFQKAWGQKNLIDVGANRAPRADGLNFPGGIALSAGKLFLADRMNHRLIGFNSAQPENGQPASFVWGQPSLTVSEFNPEAPPSVSSLYSPSGISADKKRIYVCDTNNNRVLWWDLEKGDFSNNRPADGVIGQMDADHRDAGVGNLWNPQSVHTDGKRLFVADTKHHRVLIWRINGVGFGNIASALILGQSTWTSVAVNRGGGINGPGQATLSSPQAVFSDGLRLFVGDTNNDRVLVWNDLESLTTGRAADFVLGQNSFTETIPCADVNETSPQGACLSRPSSIIGDGKRLFVGQYVYKLNEPLDYGRVLEWTLPITGKNQTPEKVLWHGKVPTPSTLSDGYIRGLILNGPDLWVSDEGAHRALKFNDTGSPYVPVNVSTRSVPENAPPHGWVPALDISLPEARTWDSLAVRQEGGTGGDIDQVILCERNVSLSECQSSPLGLLLPDNAHPGLLKTEVFNRPPPREGTLFYHLAPTAKEGFVGLSLFVNNAFVGLKDNVFFENGAALTSGLTRVIQDITPPSIPVGLTAVGKEKTLELVWTASSDAGGSGFLGYRLDVSTRADFSEFIAGWENRWVGTATAVTVTELAPGTKYYVRVRAYDGAGNPSDNSGTLVAQTKVLVPKVFPPVDYGVMFHMDGDRLFPPGTNNAGVGSDAALLTINNEIDGIADAGVNTVKLGLGAESLNFPTTIGSRRDWRLSDPSCDWTGFDDLRGRALTAKALFENNKDPILVAMMRAKERGLKRIVSFRIADSHFAANPMSHPLTTDFYLSSERSPSFPERIAIHHRGQSPVPGYPSYANLMDFGLDKVRNQTQRILEEAIDLYGNEMDGFEIDFTRSIALFPFGDGAKKESQNVITNLVLTLKNKIQQKEIQFDRRILFSIRVSPDLSVSLQQGVDVGRLIKEKGVDLVVASNIMTLAPDMDLAPLTDLGKNNNVAIYAGLPARKPWGWDFIKKIPILSSAAFSANSRVYKLGPTADTEMVLGAALGHRVSGVAGVELYNFANSFNGLGGYKIGSLLQKDTETRGLTKVFSVLSPHQEAYEGRLEQVKKLPALMNVKTGTVYANSVDGVRVNSQKSFLAAPIQLSGTDHHQPNDSWFLFLGVRSPTGSSLAISKSQLESCVLNITLNGSAIWNQSLFGFVTEMPVSFDGYKPPTLYAALPMGAGTKMWEGQNELRLIVQPDPSAVNVGFEIREIHISHFRDEAPPSVPSSFKVIGSTQAIGLTWGGSTDGDGTGVMRYRVDVSSVSDFVSWVGDWKNKDMGFLTTATVTGLAPETTYFARVRAEDAAGNVSASAGGNAVTLPDTEKPTSPEGLMALGKDQSIGLSWSASTDTGGSGLLQYRVDVSSSANFVPCVGEWDGNPVGLAVGVTVLNLKASTTYYARVRAQDGAGNLSEYSLVASTKTAKDLIKPTVPGSLTVTGKEGSLDVAWAASTDLGGSEMWKYLVYVSTVPNASYPDALIPGWKGRNMGLATFANVTGLGSDKMYYVRVRAMDNDGNSAYTDWVGAKTIPLLDGSDYNHFGIVSKGAGGRLHLIYRKALTHTVAGAGVYRFSDDDGVSWSPAKEILPQGVLDPNDDVRVGCIGTTPTGRIIVVYSRKTTQQNWRSAYSDDGGATWTTERPFDPNLTQGLPYGRLLALPDGRLLVTGYVALNGKFSLAHWYSSNNGETWERGADVLTYYSSSGYLFDEHSVIPVTNSQWLAVSRGQSSFVFYKTNDSGNSWTTIGEMVDTMYPNIAHDKLVAPMLDIIPGGDPDKPYVLLTYADRETSKSYYRIGRTDQFTALPQGRVSWGPAHDYAQNFKVMWPSGYQSGIFINNDRQRYLLIDYDHRGDELSVVRQFTLDLSDAGLYSEIPSASSDLTGPSVPQNLQLVETSTGTVKLKWDAATETLLRYGVDFSSNSTFTKVLKGWRDHSTPAFNFPTATIEGLTPNTTYYARVRAYDLVGNVSLDGPVLMVKTDPELAIAITAPAPNTLFTTGQTVSVQAEADPKLEVTKVWFTLDGVTVSTDTTAPYSYDWPITSAMNGVHLWQATVFDTLGNSSTTVGVPVTVDIDVTKPTVALTAPIAGTTYTTPQSVAITATATDNVGVTTVCFILNDVVVSTDTTAPYAYNWPITGANNGAHTWKAMAFDAIGNSSTTVGVPVTVYIDATNPTVALTVPVPGTTYITPQSVPITANAKDNVEVSKVWFILNGVTVSTATTAPYSYDWPITSANNGAHIWQATVFDALGNSSTTVGVPVTVNIDVLPPSTPVLLAPTEISSTTVRLNWSAATDNVGVAGYRLYRGTSPIATISGEETTYLDTGLLPATRYKYTVSAFDARGNTSALSLELSVTTKRKPLLTPRGSLSGVSSQSVGIRWPAVEGANRYTLAASVSETSETEFAVQREIQQSESSDIETISGLLPNTTYYLYLNACDESQCTEFAPVGIAVTHAMAPLLTSAEGKGKEIRLTINGNGNPTGTKYRIEMSRGGGEFTLATTGTSLSPVIGDLTPGERYSFRVKAENHAGVTTEPSNTLGAALAPGNVECARAYPVPFRPGRGATGITFDQIPENSTVRILTMDGRSVKTLIAGSMGEATWDLKNDDGQAVASGVYVVILKNGGGKKVLKVLVQK